MNEEIIENIIFFILGTGFGWILHIIVSTIRETKREVDEVLQIERRRDEAGILQHRIAFNVTFSLMLIFVFYAAFTSFQVDRELEEDRENDFTALCRSGEELRWVQRNTVDAIYSLALSVVSREVTEPPRTPEELAETNRFIERANEFRRTSYRDIKPSERCLDYVKDDVVDPPTPDQPPLLE